jgi:hypothetical protein
MSNWNIGRFVSMKRACLLAVLMIAVISCTGARGQKPEKPPNVGDVQPGSAAMNPTIPEPARWEEGFPIPVGARRNDSRGGATSVAPGKNYTLTVYEIDAGVEAMTAFYGHHLPEAKRVSVGQEVRFATPGGYVRLARIDNSTRITLVIGPH